MMILQQNVAKAAARITMPEWVPVAHHVNEVRATRDRCHYPSGVSMLVDCTKKACSGSYDLCKVGNSAIVTSM